MPAVFPEKVAGASELKTDIQAGTKTVGVHANHHNQLALEVIATQATLGAKPAGSHGTVRGRLEAAERLEFIARGSATLSSPAVVADIYMASQPQALVPVSPAVPAAAYQVLLRPIKGVRLWAGQYATNGFTIYASAPITEPVEYTITRRPA